MTWAGASPFLAGLLAALLLAPTPAPAQTDPRLVEAVRAAQEGNSDSARKVVQQMLAATSPTDSLYAEILYTQAMVAGDATEMRRNLQRVVLEHGASPWADDALLRLVQMDYAIRDLEPAARNLERLRADYPVTPLLPQASYWAARTYFDLNNAPLACRWLNDGIAQAQDVELRNQLGYLRQRCAAVPQAAAGADTAAGTDTAAGRPAAGQTAGPPVRQPDSAPPAAPPPAAPVDTARPADSVKAAPAGPPPRFRVQVAAVATPGAADDAATRIEQAGYQAVIVREGKFYKVRAGPFASREEARAAQDKLKARLGGSPFIVADD